MNMTNTQGNGFFKMSDETLKWNVDNFHTGTTIGQLARELTELRAALASAPHASPAPTEAPMANAIDDVKPVGYLFRLRYGTDRWSDQLMYSNILPKEGDYKEVQPLYASPAPSQHTGWSDEVVKAAMRLVDEYAQAVVDEYADLQPPAAPPYEQLRRNVDEVIKSRAALEAALAASSIAPVSKDIGVKPFRYPKGMTEEEWKAGPARSSALRAADLPED